MNGEENSLSMKGCSVVSEEHMDSKDGISGDNSSMKLDGLETCSIDASEVKAEVGSYQVAEVKSEGLDGDTIASHGDGNESLIGVLGDGKCCKIENLDCSIEEGLVKVKLVGDEGGLVQTDNGMKEVGASVLKEDSDNDSDSDTESESENSDSESEASPSSSSTSSSTSESDGDDDKVEEKFKEAGKLYNRTNVNTEGPGQIIDSDAVNMVSRSETDDEEDNSTEYNEEFQFDDDVADDDIADDDSADEDEDTVNGPIKSQNELEVLPPVPPVNVTLQPSHQILPVGVISSVLGAKVIVEGSERHNPLSEGSILWITESRLPLGIVDEIFGPVKTPYYIVRFNSESEVPSIQNGTMVGFVAEFVGHVLNDKNLYQKGYDASGEHDEDVLDEPDFSDDEKEAEYKRMLKMSKRGNNRKRKNRRRNKTWTKDQPSMSLSPGGQSSQPGQLQQQPCVPSGSEGNWSNQASASPGVSGGHVVPPFSPGYQLGPSPMSSFSPGGPAAITQQVQQAGLLLNGLLGNLIGIQQQNMGMSSGFQMNGMSLPQQNYPQNLQVPAPGLQQQQMSHSQMPLMNPVPFQQPFDFSQLVGASATPFSPASFSTGPPNGPWVGTLGQNFPIQAPLSLNVQGQSPQLPMSPAMVSNIQQGQSCDSPPQNGSPGNAEVFSQFSQGSSPGRGGRGRGRKTFHHRGGRFSGGRGRQQPN